MHTARSSATATLLPNGKVLIVGGMSALPLTQDFYASAELYDPATGKFTKTGSMTAARAQHTAPLLAMLRRLYRRREGSRLRGVV
jgi:hypothetical protein